MEGISIYEKWNEFWSTPKAVPPTHTHFLSVHNDCSLEFELSPTQKVQVLNFLTPFRPSQYIIFSHSWSTLKAHSKKFFEIFEKFLGSEDISNPPKNSNNPTHFEMLQNAQISTDFTFHPLETGIVVRKIEKKWNFLWFQFFQDFSQIHSQNYLFQWILEIEQKLKNYKIWSFKVGKMCGAFPHTFL